MNRKVRPLCPFTGALFRGITMNTRHLHFALLALTFSLTGCAAGSGDGSWDEDTHSFELADSGESSFAADMSSPDIELTQAPRIEAFSASPRVLPVGGGEVQITWSSRHSVACSMSFEGREVKVAAEGAFEIEVDESTTLGINCFDEIGSASQDAKLDIDVQTTPVHSFDTEAQSISLSNLDATTVAAKVDSETPIQFEVVLEGNALLLARANSEGMASDISIWLAQDIDGNGQLEQDEVIDYNLNRPEVDAQDRLDAGTYYIIVCPDAETSGFFLTLTTKPA